MSTVKEYPIHHLINMALRWKKQIILIQIAFVCLGFILAFVVDRQYKSTAALLPPRESGMLGLSSLSTVMKSLPSGIGKLAGGGQQDSYDYVAILRSRTVIEQVIDRFDLKRVYAISDSSVEKTIKEFRANYEVEWADGDVFEVRVWDEDAKRASDITNFLVDILNQRSIELQTQEAKNNRQFIENRVRQNQLELKKAEDALKAYQIESGTIVSTQPAVAGFSAIAEMYGMKALKEIEIGVLEKTVGQDNQELKQRQIELMAINDKIKDIPDIGITSLRLYREVAIQQKILEFLIPLYEEAKVNEAKNVPVAYILDKGVPGERPDRPKRLLILAISTFLGLVASFLFIAVKEVRMIPYVHNSANL